MDQRLTIKSHGLDLSWVDCDITYSWMDTARYNQVLLFGTYWSFDTSYNLGYKVLYFTSVTISFALDNNW